MTSECTPVKLSQEIGQGRIKLLAIDRDHEAVCRAVELLQEGGLIFVQVGGVVGIAGDARDTESLQAIQNIKDDATDPIERKFVAPQFTDRIVPFVDMGRITPPLQHLFSTKGLSGSLLGAICNIRVPIKKGEENQFPPCQISWDEKGPKTQFIDPTGNPGFENLVHEANKKGLQIAITTANRHGDPEPEKLKDAWEYVAGLSEEKRAPIKAICSNRPGFRIRQGERNKDGTYDQIVTGGSYAILDVVEGCFRRDSSVVPVDVLKEIIGVPELGIDGMKPAAYHHVDFSEELQKGLTGMSMREAVLDKLYGKSRRVFQE